MGRLEEPLRVVKTDDKKFKEDIGDLKSRSLRDDLLFLNREMKRSISSKVYRYLLKNMNMNNSVKKKVNFINSSQNKGLSPSFIALSFDGLGSI
jgi:hypothetical protein